MKFQLKDEKVVLERWSLDRKKISKTMSEEKKWDFCRRAFNTKKQSLIEELVEREDTKIGIETAIQRQRDGRRYQGKSDGAPQRDQETRFRRRWSFSKTSQNYWSTFCERKQRLTAKLNNRNRSYVQNNRNRKVNSK